MFKRLFAIVVLILPILCIGCGAPSVATQDSAASAVTPRSAAAAQFPLTVTDDAGRTVTIPRAPQRIVSLAPSQTEVLFALGLGAKIVGVDQYSDHPTEATQKAKVTGYARPDLEQVVAMAPDLVLANPIHTKTAVPEMERLKLTVVVLNPASLDDVFESVLLIGKATGAEEQATQLTGRLRERAGNVAVRVANAGKPRVFFELSPTLHTPGDGSFINDLIQRAGGTNVAADIPVQWPQIGLESLHVKDPEVIILSYPGSETPDRVVARPGWQTMTALRNKRVYAIDPNITGRAGPRVVDGLEELAKAIHPEVFR